MTHDLLFCLLLLNGKRLKKFLQWFFLYTICLQNHPKVNQKTDVITSYSWRQNWHYDTKSHLFYMRKFVLQLKVPFFHRPRLHSQIPVERFWFNPTAWHRDVMTSRHDVTKHILPISACRCARKMILVSFLWYLVAEFENFVSFLFAWLRHVMTSCHDVKTGCTLSQLVEVLERWFFLFLYDFFLFL